MTGCHWGVWLVKNMHVATPNKMQILEKNMSNIFMCFFRNLGMLFYLDTLWMICHFPSEIIRHKAMKLGWFPVEQPSFNRGSEVAGFCPEIWWTPRALVHRLGCCSMMFYDVPPAENGPTPTWSILILKYWIDEHQHSPVHLLVTFTRAEIWSVFSTSIF